MRNYRRVRDTIPHELPEAVVIGTMAGHISVRIARVEGHRVELFSWELVVQLHSQRRCGPLAASVCKNLTARFSRHVGVNVHTPFVWIGGDVPNLCGPSNVTRDRGHL